MTIEIYKLTNHDGNRSDVVDVENVFKNKNKVKGASNGESPNKKGGKSKVKLDN